MLFSILTSIISTIMKLLQNIKDKAVAGKEWFFNLSLIVKIVLLLIFCGGVGVCVWGMRSTATQTQYQTATVEKGTIMSTVSESGSITNDTQTSITSPTDGVITEIYVKNGDDVKSGQKLFKVKSTATTQAKASAYASYLGAKNSLSSAEAKLNSLQSSAFSANQKFVNDAAERDLATTDPTYIQEWANWLQAESDYKNQSTVIAQAKASLQSATLSYQATQDSVVTAPVAGTVANLSISVGSNVSAGSTSTTSSTTSTSTTSTGGSTILVLGDFSNLYIKASVSQSNIAAIKVGQKATITLDALENQTFVGTITSVDTIGTNSSGVVTYNVYITLMDPPTTIQPAMTASAVIQTAVKNDALSVLTSAIHSATDGSSYVEILKDGKVSNVTVTTGIVSDTNTEIASGVSEGDVIVVKTVSSGSTTTTRSTSTTSLFSGTVGGGMSGGMSGGGGPPN